MITTSKIVTDAIEKKLAELRATCALQKEGIRHAQDPKAYWGDDSPGQTYWADMKAKCAAERPIEYAASLKVLADFIAEHRPLMGSDWIGNDHGRLCWGAYLGGTPIRQRYCQCAEDHAGDCGDQRGSWPQGIRSDHEWYRLLNPPLPDPPLPTHDDEYGDRDGPCVIEYQDWTQQGWPTHRSYSCLGCRHFERGEYEGSHYCKHPHFLKKYQSKQSMGGNFLHRDKVICGVNFCPALAARGEARPLLNQPPPNKNDRERATRLRPSEWASMLIIPKVKPKK